MPSKRNYQHALRTQRQTLEHVLDLTPEARQDIVRVVTMLLCITDQCLAAVEEGLLPEIADVKRMRQLHTEYANLAASD